MLTEEEKEARESSVKYWKEGDFWRCAEAGKDPFSVFKWRLQPWWKHYGLRGKGKTKKEALEDWRSWMNARDFVADIY